jgi:hypothetical protein
MQVALNQSEDEMSQVSNGIVYKTPSGKFVRTFQVRNHVGTREFVQETPDIHCATVVRGLYQMDVKRMAEREFGELTEVEIEITREIKILRDGQQPSLC